MLPFATLGKFFYGVGFFSCLCLLFFVPFQPVLAQVPFGGPITFLNPICETPPATELYIGPPTPMPLMYMPGAISFAYGPPSHPGQYLLGWAAGYVPCIIWVPCGFVICPIVIGGGLLIISHGSSI